MTTKLFIFSLPTAVVLLVSAGQANVAIDNGAGGNGGLFFNIWDANGSYSRDLGTTIDTFWSSWLRP